MTQPNAVSRVVVTGAAGLIGSVVAADLSADHDVVALDRRWRAGNVRRVDTRKRRRAERAFAGADAVVDLASTPSVGAPWRVVLGNNLSAATTCFEIAAELGIRRVVYASSNHVTGGYEQDEPYASVLAGRYDGLDPADLRPISSADPIRPDSPYAVGKAAAELAGRLVAETHGVSVICLRLGHVMRANSPRTPRDYSTFLSHRDLVHLVRCALTAPDDVRFAVVYGVSANTWRIWDLDEPRRLLHYEPVDDAESMRPVAQAGDVIAR